MSAQPPLPTMNRDTVLEDLKTTLIELADGQLAGVEIDPSGHLLDHGYIDSLSAVLFLSHIAEHYGAEIEDMEFLEQLYTLDLLADRLMELGS